MIYPGPVVYQGYLTGTFFILIRVCSKAALYPDEKQLLFCVRQKADRYPVCDTQNTGKYLVAATDFRLTFPQIGIK